MKEIIETIIAHPDAQHQSQVVIHQGEIFTYWDKGLTRYVYANEDKTKVIKVLINPNSVDYNLEEGEIYANASEDKKSQLAKTTIVNGVIEQEFVTPIKMDTRPMSIPQMMFASSCRDEVGWNSEGELVCFDLDEFKKY